MSAYKFSVIVEKCSDGYFAFCPELQGCYTQGDTYEEVLLTDGDDIEKVALDLQRLLTDHELRETLRSRGLKRAEAFN
jgi:hypothetical protein